MNLGNQNVIMYPPGADTDRWTMSQILKCRKWTELDLPAQPGVFGARVLYLTTITCLVRGRLTGNHHTRIMETM